MTLKTIREDIIKEFITKQLLDDNIYPTLELICSMALENFGDVSVFKSILTDSLQLDKNAEASRGLFNTTTKYAAIDIKTLYAFTNYLSNTIEDQKNKIRQRLSTLSKAIEALTTQASAIVMLNNNADCFEVYTETFDNLTNIDLDDSSAAIDTINHYAYVLPNLVSLPAGKDIISSIDINCTTANYYSCQNLTGNPISNLYDGYNDTLWINQVTMPSDYIGQVEIILKINLNSKITLNKLSVKLNDSNTNDYQVQALALIDGVWTNLTDYITCGNYVDISFGVITTDSIILKLKTDKYVKSGSSLIYSFYGQEIIFQNSDHSNTSLLQLKDVEFSKKFNSVSFDVETDIPTGCNIDIYAAPGTDTVWQDFSKIDSTNFLSVSEDDSVMTLPLTVDLTCTHPYNSGSNICLSYQNPTLPDYDLSKTKLIRQLGTFSLSNGISKCYFYSTASTLLDLTKTPGYVDNVYCSTTITVEPGIHSFSFTDTLSQSIYAAALSVSNIKFGAYLASYVINTDFINIAEDNNLEVFTIANINSNNTLIVKSTDFSENLLFIESIKQTTEASKLRVKFVLSGTNQYTPKIKSIKIKAA